jgi:type III secretory pathway lipoprotein EscJ
MDHVSTTHAQLDPKSKTDAGVKGYKIQFRRVFWINNSAKRVDLKLLIRMAEGLSNEKVMVLQRLECAMAVHHRGTKNSNSNQSICWIISSKHSDFRDAKLLGVKENNL